MSRPSPFDSIASDSSAPWPGRRPALWHRVVSWLRNESRRDRSRRRWARWIGRNWARISYAWRVEPTWLELNRCDVPIQDLPSPFDGLRIAQLSDFHCGRHVPLAYLQEAIELAQSERPDLIVLTGDFIHTGFRYVDVVAETLGQMSAPLGVYAVLGNHDFSVRNALGYRRHRHLHRAVAEALTARGICVLRNETVELVRGEARLYLTGVEDLWSRVCDLDAALEGLAHDVPRIVLAHNPRTVEHLNGRRCDLMLSGHTHGGQVNWPGLGRPVLGRHTRRFAAGLYRYKDTYLYVNKGIGFSVRFRFGVRPEVAVVTLRAAS
ncbi:MAG: phosphodiesterase YaeI [Gemmataceae bacterium]|nr:phosphodiesterase YaeI [Gemmataceae bacterium]MDW8264188.1 phosphodiesterase YaeI [Gemmataceae bacterium]